MKLFRYTDANVNVEVEIDADSDAGVDLKIDLDVDVYADVDIGADVDSNVDVDTEVDFDVECKDETFRCVSIVENFCGSCIGLFCVLDIFLPWFLRLDFAKHTSSFPRWLRSFHIGWILLVVHIA